ncbi:MAG: surface lipoprotein assembly modifier [Candidatus Tectomicrobia bacterium]|nr:surface lipoprotein assembly modifier [Candidatus Tectomicrobia bacterium]
MRDFVTSFPPMRRVFVIASCLFFAVSAWGADHEPLLPFPTDGESSVTEARALIDAGRFKEALEVLAPLVQGEVIEANAFFLYGLAALELSQQAEVPKETRHALLNQAIAIFREILVNRPDLVRVRLELARAFFLKGRDGLARRHFTQVLAGGVPPPVAANVYGFLNVMRARKRWTGYFGAAVAPDSNLNAASDTETIYIDVFGGRLPFQRQGDFGAKSGLGLSVWGGGEYQLRDPLSERLRLRVGADAVQREYSGGDFDQLLLAAHAGPRWLTGPRTEISLLGVAQRQWLGSRPYQDETGMRLEIDHRLGLAVWARGTASVRERDHKQLDFLDGPLTDFTLNLAWAVAPVLRVQFSLGYERDHAESVHYRNLSRWVRVGTSLALPLGFTLGTSAQMRRTYYEGNGCVHQVLGCRQRLDRTRTFSVSVLNRGFTLLRFSPQLALIHEARVTNAQALDYDRNRAELRFVRQF